MKATNMWYLESTKNRGERIANDFPSQGAAEGYLDKLGPVIKTHYKVVAETGNPVVDRMLTEGLEQGDLANILLPRVSVDEYVPSDPDTDNVVLAFFIKGVPDATLPLRNFCDVSNGVLVTDYGNSDTVVGTQIVYVEFDRENLEMEDIHGLMLQIAMIASLEVDDFTMTFPHTNKKFPYDIALMKQYFDSRTERKNLVAQKKAEKERQEQANRQIQKAQAHRDLEKQKAEQPKDQPPKQEPLADLTQKGEPLGDLAQDEEPLGDLAQEAMVSHMVGSFIAE